MRTVRHIFCGLWIGVALPHGAAAADATADGAGQIRTGLERYLGQGALTVAPVGQGYKIDIDLKAMLKGLERFGLTLDPADYSMTASPTGEATWHVTSGGVPPISAKFGQQTTSIVSNGQTFEGLFDTRIPAFTQWTGRYDSTSLGITDKGAATQTRQVTKGEQTFSATPSASGVIDGTLARSNASFAQDIVVDNPQAHFDLSIKSGRTTDHTSFEGLHVGALADLWAFFVAHPSLAAIKASQPALRALLRQALPLFQHWTQDGTLENLDVRGPFGPIGARQLATHLDLHGLTAEGSAGLTIKADGLTVPTDALPPWSAALIPTGFELATTVSGYRLDEAARTVVDEFDLEAPQPLSQATIAKLPPLLGSRDAMLVSIGASHVATPTLDAQFSGAIHLTQPRPSVAMTIRATGFDRAIASVQDASRQDPSAARVVSMLILAKGYGKAEPDGALTWAVATTDAGAITINGVPLPTAKPE